MTEPRQDSLVTFVIPVRHQDNAKSWPELTARLAQTMASVAAQSHPDWQGIVVANHGAQLPPLPPGFCEVRVDFPPNDMHELGKQGHEAFYEAFRLDKGRRVLAGMLAAPGSRYFMIVDDDDFVSREIAGFLAEQPEENGWTIDRGYVWSEDGNMLIQHDNFHYLCGTSLVVRGELYALPRRFEDADMEWVKSMLGSHVQIAGILEKQGRPLASLPFRGAVYRVGHTGSHSRAPGIARMYFFNAKAWRNPRQIFRDLRKLRRLTPALRREFFGA